MQSQTQKPTQNEQPKFELSTSRQFSSWLAEQKASLTFTTYQAGKFFLIGLQENQKLSIFERTFPRCMGLCSHENSIYLTSLYQIWRFENALLPGQNFNGFDRVYLPTVGYTTGDVDAHDIAMDKNGRIVFVNTLFSCLATISEEYSFVEVWRPKFISKLAAEDRCHLNGMTLVDGLPRYVTSVSTSDAHEGWREHRGVGGVVIDVTTDDVVCEDLSMPHSPRWYNGKLWLLDSGTGYLGYVDMKTGKFERVTFCLGYARGLSFIGNYAVVGISKCRQNRTFSDLALDKNLSDKKTEARCGLLVIDLNSGDIVHSMRIEGVVEELYDVMVLPNVARPMAIGFKTDEIRHVLRIPPQGD